jgi:two-component system, cell cycle response regulator DivK
MIAKRGGSHVHETDASRCASTGSVITVTGLPPPSASSTEGEKTAPVAKILLVEDNEMNRDMLSRRLQRKGFEVVMAEDGRQGVSVARKERPDLILMDMSLPVVDGWQAARELKADDETRHIPIIALTAHAMSGDRERAIEAGCDDYDTKPVELPRLLSKIEGVLEKKSPA